MKPLALIAGVATLVSAPAMADAYQPPDGCEGVLTVQSRACLVTLVWQCRNDGQGDQWIAMFSQNGPFQVRKVDREFQWLETYYADHTERMEQPAPDPENLSELFAEGVDTYDFTTITDDGAAPQRIVGYDRLTGETVEIDGEPLLRTHFAYQSLGPEGEVTYAGEGDQYVSTRHRLFFLGTSWEQSTPEDVFEATPVEFIYPGEPGFFETTPRYDCGSILSSY